VIRKATAAPVAHWGQSGTSAMRLEKRIQALEARLIADPVILQFADGSTKEICGQGDFLMDLFRAAFGGTDLNSQQVAQLDLIRKSVRAEEPGGGHMIELLKSILNSPL